MTALPSEAEPRQQVRQVRRGRRLPEDLRSTVRLDRRTRVGRDVAEFRASLLRHVGGSPTATQRATIELAVQLRARLVAMDFAFAENGDQSGHDSRTYLSWSNSLSRAMFRLGMKAAAERPPTLDEIMGRSRTGVAA